MKKNMAFKPQEPQIRTVDLGSKGVVKFDLNKINSVLSFMNSGTLSLSQLPATRVSQGSSQPVEVK